jgi:hypothetical protein
MELLKKDGYQLGQEHFIIMEAHIESVVNQNPEFDIKVEITRGNKIKGTILQAIFTYKEDDYIFASMVLDIDEVLLEDLETIWEHFAKLPKDRAEFKLMKQMLDDVLSEQGAFLGNGCIFTISSDLT